MEQSHDSSSDILPCCRSSADKFFRDLDKKDLSFKFSREEIEDIADGAYQIVLAIVGKIGCIDDRFKCTKVIRVGSFEERTRIQEPNEFDFLAVVDELSQPNAVEPVRVYKGKRGFMHVKVRDEGLKKRWATYIDSGDLVSSTTKKNFSGLVNRIYMDKSAPIVVTKPSGTMKLAGVECHLVPNTVVHTAWKSNLRDEVFKIKADLSPAIVCNNVLAVITPDDCPYERFFEEVQKYGKFLLVPGRSSEVGRLSKCFSISMSEVEVSLVQSLGVTHKRCYRVLKFFLCNLRCGAMPYPSLSSYIVKSAVLHHAGDGQCKSDSLNSCVENVLRFLLKSLVEDRPLHSFMPSVFIRDHNLFEDLTKYKWSTYNLLMYGQRLRSVLSFHQKIHTLPLPEYDYEKCLRYLKQVKVTTNLRSSAQICSV